MQQPAARTCTRPCHEHRLTAMHIHEQPHEKPLPLQQLRGSEDALGWSCCPCAGRRPSVDADGALADTSAYQSLCSLGQMRRLLRAFRQRSAGYISSTGSFVMAQRTTQPTEACTDLASDRMNCILRQELQGSCPALDRSIDALLQS